MGIWGILPVGKWLYAQDFWIVRHPEILGKWSHSSFSIPANSWGEKNTVDRHVVYCWVSASFSDRRPVSSMRASLKCHVGFLRCSMGCPFSGMDLQAEQAMGWPTVGAGSSHWWFDSLMPVHAWWRTPPGLVVVSKRPQSSCWSSNGGVWIQRTCSEMKFSFADWIADFRLWIQLTLLVFHCSLWCSW